MQRASTCIHLVAEEETETEIEIEKEIYQETEPGLSLNVQRAGYADKLEFVGMPPRAMRAFARGVVFPSFGHARFVFAVVVYSI